MEKAKAKPAGFYVVEVTWADVGTLAVALVLVLAARGLWTLELGGPGTGAGVLLWWAGVCVFCRWVALHSLSAQDYGSWAARLIAMLGAAWLFLWALGQAGFGRVCEGWLAMSPIALTVVIVVWYSMTRREQADESGESAPGESADSG